MTDGEMIALSQTTGGVWVNDEFRIGSSELLDLLRSVEAHTVEHAAAIADACTI
jgi:hypothetical protein